MINIIYYDTNMLLIRALVVVITWIDEQFQLLTDNIGYDFIWMLNQIEE